MVRELAVRAAFRRQLWLPLLQAMTFTIRMVVIGATGTSTAGVRLPATGAYPLRPASR